MNVYSYSDNCIKASDYCIGDNCMRASDYCILVSDYVSDYCVYKGTVITVYR